MEEAIKAVVEVKESVHNETDIDRYCEKIINTRIPHDRVQWEAHFVENYSKTESAVISKMHHVIGDGISMLYGFQALSDEFHPNTNLNQRFPKLLSRILMTLACILHLPISAYHMATVSSHDTCMNHRDKLSGKKIL